MEHLLSVYYPFLIHRVFSSTERVPSVPPTTLPNLETMMYRIAHTPREPARNPGRLVEHLEWRRPTEPKQVELLWAVWGDDGFSMDT